MLKPSEMPNSKSWSDCINSTGAIALPPLFDALGVEYTLLNDNNFVHFAII